jgi:two-component system OmpR family response regulator
MAEYLACGGFTVETAIDGPAMDRALRLSRFDLVILDVELPGQDELSICRRLAPANVSVILLSAVADELDRIAGLDAGADDYLAKPCNSRELLARVRAVLRARLQTPKGSGGERGIYRFGDYELNVRLALLRLPSGLAVTLTSSESALLIALLERPGRSLSRDYLLQFTHADRTAAFYRAVDCHISRIRRKLGPDRGGGVIRTITGSGYKLAAAVSRL